MPNPFARRHVRFLAREKVEVRTNREDIAVLWTKDISKGGLFVESDDPPPMRSQVEVRLTTEDGVISLYAEVVHVLDSQAAEQIGHPPGAGLQFVKLKPEVQRKIERYIDGTLTRLDRDLVTVTGVTSSENVVASAKRVMESINHSDLYGALSIEPSASNADVADAAEKLAQSLKQAPEGATPPQLARLESISRQVDRVAKLLLDPKRRLTYDFRHGHTRAEDLIAEAEAQGGPNIEELRNVWAATFPKQVDQAKELAKLALTKEHDSDLRGAIEAGVEALKADPFNLQFRDVIATWRQKVGES